MAQKQTVTDRRIASYIFSGSNTMVGVCVTVVSIFRIMKTGMQTYADETLAVDTSVFIVSSLLSYLALRKEKSVRLEKWADIFFFSGMVIIFLVALLILYTTY